MGFFDDVSKSVRRTTRNISRTVPSPGDLFEDPVGSLTGIAKDITGMSLLEGFLEDQEVDPLPTRETTEPELPQRDEVIADILNQELAALSRRRASRTLLTGGQGAPDTPLASATIFGRS